ncbi:MAG: hypothetical protein Q9175_005720, partial [Cornicularia normoerica]
MLTDADVNPTQTNDIIVTRYDRYLDDFLNAEIKDSNDNEDSVRVYVEVDSEEVEQPHLIVEQA